MKRNNFLKILNIVVLISIIILMCLPNGIILKFTYQNPDDLNGPLLYSFKKYSFLSFTVFGNGLFTPFFTFTFSCLILILGLINFNNIYYRMKDYEIILSVVSFLISLYHLSFKKESLSLITVIVSVLLLINIIIQFIDLKIEKEKIKNFFKSQPI